MAAETATNLTKDPRLVLFLPSLCPWETNSGPSQQILNKVFASSEFAQTLKVPCVPWLSYQAGKIHAKMLRFLFTGRLTRAGIVILWGQVCPLVLCPFMVPYSPDPGSRGDPPLLPYYLRPLGIEFPKLINGCLHKLML